jgi:hypothetical protein
MVERRKAKRLPINISLEILDLYKQDNVQVSNLHAPIEVINVSKTGIGFRSESVLPIGYYFNANINLNDSTIHSVVKIIRSLPAEGKFRVYGCEFVGMATVLSYLFDEYDQMVDEQMK